MVIIRKVTDLIDFFNSPIGNDLVYLCQCMLTDYGVSRVPVVDSDTLKRLVEMPDAFDSLDYRVAVNRVAYFAGEG